MQQQWKVHRAEGRAARDLQVKERLTDGVRDLQVKERLTRRHWSARRKNFYSEGRWRIKSAAIHLINGSS